MGSKRKQNKEVLNTSTVYRIRGLIANLPVRAHYVEGDFKGELTFDIQDGLVNKRGEFRAPSSYFQINGKSVMYKPQGARA